MIANKSKKQVAKLFSVIFLLSILVTSLSIQIARAVDVGFFSSNDILFFDPDSCNIKNQNGDIALQGNNVAEQIFRFLTTTSFATFGGKPFNALQAAGALGNFQQESGMDPKAIEGNGQGHGLAQWSFGRRTTLYELASSMGKDWSDINVQIKMMNNELGGPYGKSLLSAGFDKVTTPKDASYIFQKVFEGAGIPAQAKRDAAAASYYEKFKSLAPADNATPAADTPGTGDGANCTPTDPVATSGNFTIYNQFDPKWATNAYGTATIAQAGCGPSSMAMIITALTGKPVTPADTTAYANTKNLYTAAGSSWSIAPVLAQHWGLKSKNIGPNIEAINQVLRSGGYVITSGTGATPFTSGGHYITIRALTDSGKWLIGDSNGNKGAANSKKEWDPKYILDIANAGNIVAITK